MKVKQWLTENFTQFIFRDKLNSLTKKFPQFNFRPCKSQVTNNVYCKGCLWIFGNAEV